MNKKSIVSISRNKDIKLAVKFCLEHLNLPDLNDKKILLKPNVGREVDPKLAINTNPDVVYAIFNYLNERFDAEFYIGDSPIINTDSKKAFYQSGYSNLLKEKRIKFIDLDDKSPIELKIKNGFILKKIKITGYFNEFDYIISIPVLKMHMHTGASLSFKNMKGLIYKREKISLHHLKASHLIEKYKHEMDSIKELDIAIADLSRVFKPDLAVIDASYVQEGMGPSSGDSVELNIIIASKNYLAADIVALKITQPDWSLNKVPHLKIISEIHPNFPKSINDIQIIPSNLKDFIRPIEPPPKTISIKYKNVVLLDVDSCSACLSTIFNLLKNNKEFIDKYFTEEKPLRLAIGRGIKKEDIYDDTFLIGNCTYNVKEKGIFIKGCTPVESTILRIIKEKLDLND
ncbi:MAG: DUF362 domain-containing protein [Promethearchaeota archaeon]